MTLLSRRDAFLALVAFGLAPAVGHGAEEPLPKDVVAGLQTLRAAYLAQRPEAVDTVSLAANLLPEGWSEGAREALSTRITADFKARRLFIFQGWRLSDTEGGLCVLFAELNAASAPI